ncbi:MAG: transglycosylase SLT domain-containing protein [Brachymonas sp.]
MNYVYHRLAIAASCMGIFAGCATTGSMSADAPSTPAPRAAAPAAMPAISQTPPATSPAIGNPSAPIQSGSIESRPVTTLALPVDIWERIRRGFGMPDLRNDIVVSQEQWYSQRPDYITRMTERSSKYMFHIVEELERRGMPTELALLPFIESAFNPQAVSSAKAAGMWQFIPSTGKHFDLKQNAFRDDRRDVLHSTRAALDYLQKLYGMFGDWHLALAAYNWGEGSVGRAIARNKREGLGTSYSDLNMPNETRNYVPKLQAVKNIVADPARFAARLPDIANHPYFQSVAISRDIDVTLAARLAQVRVEDFKSLNPSANKPLIMAAGTPQILLPWDNAEIFTRNLAAHNGQLASWTVWSAPATLKPAEAAKRVGMSEAEFRSVNDIPGGMLIKPGSTLLIPRGAKVEQDVPEQVADHGQINLAPDIVLRKMAVKARKGDTVASLARRYKLSATQVAQWNGSSAGAALKAGQSVVVYLPVRAVAKTKGSTRVAAKAAPRGKAVAKSASKPVRVAKR